MFVVYWLWFLFVVCCVGMFEICCLLVVLLFFARFSVCVSVVVCMVVVLCSMVVVSCLMCVFGMRCKLCVVWLFEVFVVCCLLCVACCVLFVVCC